MWISQVESKLVVRAYLPFRRVSQRNVCHISHLDDPSSRIRPMEYAGKDKEEVVHGQQMTPATIIFVVSSGFASGLAKGPYIIRTGG